MTSEEIYAMFKAGTRVAVIRPCSSYKKYNLKGQLGTVVRNQYGRYGKVIVDMDTESNPRASMGYFYFKPCELSLVIEDNNDILEENTMQNVVNYVNIAKIQYLNSETPSSFNYANFDVFLMKGDLCVVKSLNHGLGLARVVDIIDQNDVQTCREIVAKVNTEDYDFRVAARKDAAELKAKMQERAKQLQDIALYQMLAENDPDMKELLSRYQSLPLF